MSKGKNFGIIKNFSLDSFTKVFLVSMFLYWFIAGVFAMVVIWRTNADLCYFLDFVKQPMADGVIAYGIKEGMTNIFKILVNPGKVRNDNSDDVNFDSDGDGIPDIKEEVQDEPNPERNY